MGGYIVLQNEHIYFAHQCSSEANFLNTHEENYQEYILV